ncbi:hypothetical protein E2C01_085442 [Portunus trituberculatus]|uniref:Uncharacterized protein n=1 Tax=Portunus trituberculatus TaxID=210409 RepID=A0A5B7J6U7_PORTR|nr:hypothetical protein [Portunus trituberculatus]
MQRWAEKSLESHATRATHSLEPGTPWHSLSLSKLTTTTTTTTTTILHLLLIKIRGGRGRGGALGCLRVPHAASRAHKKGTCLVSICVRERRGRGEGEAASGPRRSIRVVLGRGRTNQGARYYPDKDVPRGKPGPARVG